MIIGVDGNEANVKNRVGTGQYAFELLKQFAKDLPAGKAGKKHQFLIFLKDQPLYDLPSETINFKYKVFGPKKFWTQFALPIKLTFGLPGGKAGSKPNVLFSTAHYLPRFCPVPTVVTIHDLSFLHYPEMFRKSDLYQLKIGSQYSINHATHIIAVSQTTKDDIVKNYQVDSAKITVTYEGYDQSRFKPQSESDINRMKKKYQIDGDYIIFVGTLQPRKNLERLIEAFASIVHSSQLIVNGEKKTVNREPLTDNLSLVIAGKKGWLYDSIFAKVKELNLSQRVIFTGYVPDEDIPVLISGAKAYVLPSLWEGFGIPVIEAQACGVPVIVSNASSLPEIVKDSGILVDPKSVKSIADGIKKVLTNDRTRSDLVKKGFTNIKRFSWQNCAKQTLEVLEKAVLV